MIELNDVSKFFHSTEAISQIDLTIAQGERIALIGPSGSGKTTLLKLLNAQHITSSGSLKVNHLEVSELSPKKLRIFRSNIAYIPQDLGLVPSLKVYQNVLLGKIGRFRTPSMLRKILLPSRSELASVHHVLERVGIPEKLYDTTSTLSGGQQQRVAVARALYQEPHTILADEPVSAVDPARARSLIELLEEISVESKLTIVMSIHNVRLAKEYFPRILGLRQGRLTIDSSNPSESDLKSLFDLTDIEEIG